MNVTQIIKKPDIVQGPLVIVVFFGIIKSSEVT